MTKSVITLAAGIAAAGLSHPQLTGRSGHGSERTQAGRPVIVRGHRVGTDGTVAVWGADKIDPAGTRPEVDLAQMIVGNGIARQFLTDIPHAAFSNHNWLVLIHRTQLVLRHGATLGFAVADVSGKARIDFPTQAFNGNGSATAFTLGARIDLLDAFAVEARVGGVVTPVTVDSNAGDIRVTFATAPATGTGNVVVNLIPKKGVRIEVHRVTPKQVLAAVARHENTQVARSYQLMWVQATGGTVSATFVDVEPAGL